MEQRCPWCGEDPLYVAYHDTEWGRPDYDSKSLFQKLSLEAFQSGLSWITILRKRETFRTAFASFDPHVLATWGEEEITRLLQDEGIVRHRGKIEATLNNARCYLQIDAQECFAQFIWSYVDHTSLQPMRKSLEEVPSKTDISDRLSKDLKKKGFKFFGPTTAYAFMQAAGLVNDHLISCPQHKECLDAC